MTRSRERSFGQVIRERRRQLDLTQEEIAHGIQTSTPYIGHLESGKHHPSDETITPRTCFSSPILAHTRC
jgi:predicted transcriptional regulator